MFVQNRRIRVINAAQLNHSPSQLSFILVIFLTAVSVRSIVGAAGVCFRDLPTHSHFFIHVKLVLCWLVFAGFADGNRLQK